MMFQLCQKNLNREYIFTHSKIVILHILVEKSK